MRTARKPIVGEQVELLIARPGEDDKADWTPGFTVEAVMTAEDRPYRVTCVGRGRFYRECAPECVRPAGAAA